MAFELKGERQIQAAFEHLGVRECVLGGYDTKVLPCVTKQSVDALGKKLVVPALVFMAVPENQQYLGEASIPELRDHIIGCRGASGHNVEYVTRLADYVRSYIPEETDPHLFELDSAIRSKLQQLNIPLHTLLRKENPEINNNVTDTWPITTSEDLNRKADAKENRKCHNRWDSQDLPKDCIKEVKQTAAMKMQA